MRNQFILSPFCRAAIFAVAVSFTLQATPSEQIHWKDLAARLQGKLVTITTKDGRSLHGQLFTVRPEGIYISDGNQEKVLRDAVVSLHWEAPFKNQTQKLGKMLARAYRHSGKLLGTPMGPFALAELPAITAWGAAAAPFCLLGDLLSGHPPTSGDISILPDSPQEVAK
jgi:hypothetical protein